MHLAHANTRQMMEFLPGSQRHPHTHTNSRKETCANRAFPRTSPIQISKASTDCRPKTIAFFLLEFVLFAVAEPGGGANLETFPIWPSLFCVGRRTYFGKDLKCTSDHVIELSGACVICLSEPLNEPPLSPRVLESPSI